MRQPAGVSPAASPIPDPLSSPTWSPVDLLTALGAPPGTARSVLFPALQLVVFAALALGAAALFARRGRGGSANTRVPRSAVEIVAGLLALATLPVGPAWAAVVGPSAGLAVLLAALVVSLSIAPRGISTERAVGLFVAGIAAVGPLLGAGSTSLSAVVDAQRMLQVPFALAQPVGFWLYLAGASAAWNRDEDERGESFEGALRRLALAGAGVTLFLGGWWVPGFDAVVEGATSLVGAGAPASAFYSVAFVLLGTAVFAAKVGFAMFAVGWLLRDARRARCLRNFGATSAGVRLAGANLLVSAAVLALALPEWQGGWLAFVEATPRGLIFGSPLAAGLFVAFSLVAAAPLAWALGRRAYGETE